MAIKQTQIPDKTIENLLSEANAEVLGKKKDEKTAPELPQIDIENPDALRKMAKEKLVAIIQASNPTPQLVPAIKELLDRVDGKAPQSFNMNVRSAVTITIEQQKQAADDEANNMLAAIANRHKTIEHIPASPDEID